MRFASVLLLLVASVACAAPPDAPEHLKVKPGQLVRITVKADEGKLATAKNFTDSEAFWGELVGPKGQRQFVFQAPQVEYGKDGKPLPYRAQYSLAWLTVGELDGVMTTITVEGGAGSPPPIVPPIVPPKEDPKDPPPPPTGTYYFLVVRPDGPASPAFTAAMALPAWAELRKSGHKFKDKTTTEAKTLNLELPAGTQLPCVVTLSTEGGVSKIVRGPVPLPLTDAAVRALPEGVK
jgi:hypothetical protein